MKLLIKLLLKSGTFTPAFWLTIASPVNATIADDRGYSVVTAAVAGENLWSNPATWGGSVPLATDAVTIAAGQTVILDTAAVCLSLDIAGTLTTNRNANVSLTAGNINVGGSGKLEIGTEASPFPSNYTATITLNGSEASRTTRTVSGTTLGFTNNGVGRSLQVQPGGILSLIGQAPAVKRTKLNASATNGATTLTLADVTGWKAGDEIAVGTTDFFGVQTPDKLTLASNASGTSITTTTGVSSARWGALQYVTDAGMSLSPGTLTTPPAGAPTVLDERAFVAHLSRNIVVQGVNDSAWTTNKFGAHCMFMGRNSLIQLDGVQFRRVGQAGAIGRYPIHWHMMSYDMSAGMNVPSPTGTFLGAVIGNHYVKNCAVEQSGQRMVVIHGTHGVTCDSNIGFDITGHAIFLEDGAEQDNVITNNVVMKVRSPTAANKILNHDAAAPADGEMTGNFLPNGTAGIWFTNPKNTLTGNWVNDSEGAGIWHAFSTQCFGLSINVALVPTNIGITTINNNWASGNKGVGIQTNRPQSNDKGDIMESQYVASFLSNPITDLRMFKNSAGGYSNRVFEGKYSGFISADNTNMDVFGQANQSTSLGEKFLVVAESLNNATSRRVATKRSAFASYHELLNFKDTIAVGYEYISGSQYYTNDAFRGGGLFRLEDLYTGPVFTFSLNTGIKQINGTAPYRTRSANIDGFPLNNRNWGLAGVIKDLNGLFVPAGKYWVYNNPFLTYGLSGSTNVYAGADAAGSNGVYTDDRFFGVTPEEHTADSFADSQNYLPITVLQQDAGGVTQGTWSIGDGTIAPKLGMMRHFAVRNGGRYQVSFPGNIANTVSEFKVSMMDDVNDIFLMGVEFSGGVAAKVVQRASQFISRTGRVPNVPSGTDITNGIARQLTATGSFANVVADTTGTVFYQDTGANLVWFKVKVGSLALAYDSYPTGAGAPYKNVAIAVTS
jgi:G8 domain